MNTLMSLNNTDGIRFHDTRFDVHLADRAFPLFDWRNITVPEPYQAGPGPFIGWWDAYTPAGEIPPLPTAEPLFWWRQGAPNWNLYRPAQRYVK